MNSTLIPVIHVATGYRYRYFTFVNLRYKSGNAIYYNYILNKCQYINYNLRIIASCLPDV